MTTSYRVRFLGPPPHTRGAPCTWTACGPPPGPPPHTRGAPGPQGVDGPPVGTTPAYAGSTASARARARGVRDHPRIRGEHPAPHPGGQGARGPPPHTRGAPVPGDPAHEPRGTTPAYAGSTCCAKNPRARSRDHPRIRGEHSAKYLGDIMDQGPPPHTRGAHPCGACPCRCGGTTPAYAGSTAPPHKSNHRSRDHPRIRGEHGADRENGNLRPGPPPHTRGAQSAGSVAGSSPGTTPAYAGSTGLLGHHPVPHGDHPRIRGEHELMNSRASDGLGPPPHTRGALYGVRGRDDLDGTTPAYAGSTRPGDRGSSRPRDHPRIRGEHWRSLRPGW